MGRRRSEKHGGLPGELPESYTTICWRYHPKECVVCGEFRIVAVHHHNGHHWDDRPENLVPLCPTHHNYWHSEHRHLIEEQVNDYVTRFVEEGKKFDDPFD